MWNCINIKLKCFIFWSCFKYIYSRSTSFHCFIFCCCCSDWASICYFVCLITFGLYSGKFFLCLCPFPLVLVLIILFILCIWPYTDQLLLSNASTPPDSYPTHQLHLYTWRVEQYSPLCALSATHIPRSVPGALWVRGFIFYERAEFYF